MSALLPTNLRPITGFMWCTMHDDIADEASTDPSRCAASTNDREPRNRGTDCHLVTLLRSVGPEGRPVAPRAIEPHTHDDPAQLHIGCPGCIERVRLDQDIAGALHGRVPARRPVDRMHVRLVMYALGLTHAHIDPVDIEFMDEDDLIDDHGWASSGPAGSDDWADWACVFASRCPDAARAYLDLRRGGV